MTKHVDTALFVYVQGTENLCNQLLENPFKVTITPVALAAFLDEPEALLAGTDHVIFSGPLDDFKRILHLATQYDFSVGLLPLSGQKDLSNCYGLPKKFDAVLDIALQKDAQVMDVILCNKKILLFKATIGRLPLIDSSRKKNWLQLATTSLRRCIGMKLLPFQFSTGSGKTIKTAASGCMIVQHHACHGRSVSKQHSCCNRCHASGPSDGPNCLPGHRPGASGYKTVKNFHAHHCSWCAHRPNIGNTHLLTVSAQAHNHGNAGPYSSKPP